MKNSIKFFLREKCSLASDHSKFGSFHLKPTDPLFIRWQVLAKARYVKAMYKAAKDAEDQKHFIELVGNAKSVLQDPSRWNTFLHERDKEKRPIGRPPMAPEDRKRPPVKRSDEMKALLLKRDIVVNDNGTIEGYEGFTFLQNGRIRTPENDVISTRQFIHDYVWFSLISLLSSFLFLHIYTLHVHLEH